MNEAVYFNLNPVNFFIISGLVQNFILIGILWFRVSDRPLANKILAMTILIVNLHLTFLMILDTNLEIMFPFMLWIPYSFTTAIGPLIFLYTKALTRATFSISKESLKHFVPILVELVFQLIQIVYSISHDEIYYNTPFYFYFTPIIYIWTAISIYYYLRLSLGAIRNHEAWVLKTFSNLKEKTLNWLRKLIVYYRLFWVVWVPFLGVFLLFFRFDLQYLSVVLLLYLLMLILTYLTFWIGIEDLKNGNMALSMDQERPKTKAYNPTSEEMETIMNKLNQQMSVDKIYRNENLTLRELSTLINADPNLISFVLNNHAHNNFHDFVNLYRIKEVKSRLHDPAYSHLSLLGVAMESGFNSKTTFNRVFKKLTGMTPSQFQKKL